MPDAKNTQASITRDTLRVERARDAARALQEVESERKATLAKTARLRAQRLAQEAGGVERKTKRPK